MSPAFFRRWEATEREIAGRTVRMLFSLRAAARLEAALGGTYPEILLEMLQVPADPTAPMPPPMKLERQAEVVRILMSEAGDDVSMEELQNLHLADFMELARMAQEELALKSWSEEQAKKNGSPAAGSRIPSAGPS